MLAAARHVIIVKRRVPWRARDPNPRNSPPVQEEHVQHISELRHLRALDLVNLDYPSAVGPHDLQNVLGPLTRLTALRTLGLHVSPAHLAPWALHGLVCTASTLIQALPECDDQHSMLSKCHAGTPRMTCT